MIGIKTEILAFAITTKSFDKYVLYQGDSLVARAILNHKEDTPELHQIP